MSDEYSRIYYNEWDADHDSCFIQFLGVDAAIFPLKDAANCQKQYPLVLSYAILQAARGVFSGEGGLTG